ncbi:MAG TPA: hypothetical protein VK194_05880 [Candidatus Deferrimicrobium sp.]|nr:hypothetical protein [Candidatus Deferrimicrobium sp.]
MTTTLTPTRSHPAFLAKADLAFSPRPRWLGGPTLTVADPKTGRAISLPIATVEVDGAHYIVSPEGETDWVRDLRAGGEGVIRRGRTGEHVRAAEIRGGEHDRVVAAFRDQMGERTSEPFALLPDPADHPVFRIEPDGPHSG